MEKILSEDYCSYEVSKLLKEKGFDGETNTYYYVTSEYTESKMYKSHLHTNWNSDEHYYSAPTHQMAMKWLREKGWHIIILFDYRYVDEKLAYIPVITPMKAGDAIDLKQGGFPTHKKAVEAALKYCLTELI